MSITTIDEQELKAIINSLHPIAIYIRMDDCPPCNMLAPKLEAMAQDYEDRVSVFKVKVDDDSPVLNEFDVEAIPTLLFFKGGKEISRLEGMVHSKELDHHFKQAPEL